MTSYCHIVTPVFIEDFMRKEAKKHSDEYTRVGYSGKRGDIPKERRTSPAASNRKSKTPVSGLPP